MLAFIVTILFSATVAYFATQNTSPVTLHFLTYTWTGIPLYLVMLSSLITGLLFAWLFHVLKAISFSLILKGKNKALKEGKAENLELTKKVHKLELENTKLSSKDGDKSYVEDNSL
jgi:uncharacterized integral membrane protein